MILTPREQNIAKITAAAVGILVAYTVVIAPFFENLSTTSRQLKDEQAKLDQSKKVIRREQELKKDWDSIKVNLKDNRNAAESQAQEGVNGAGEDLRVKIDSFKNDRNTQENKFDVINFHVTGRSSISQVARMVYYMEIAKIPIRINTVQFVPRAEGTDDLQVTMNISTLSIAAATPTENRSPVPVTTGGQP